VANVPALSTTGGTRTPPTLWLLSRLHGTLAGSRPGMALRRRLPLRALGRLWLRRAVVEALRDQPDDVTVVIGVRNRTDYRLGNALRSIRDQSHPSPLIRILVVDYGSEPRAAALVANVCREHGAQYVHVEEAGVWSRSRCLNVGIRRVETTFVLTSDVDILLSKDYLTQGIRALRKRPLSVVGSAMLDLPEEFTEVLRSAACDSGPLCLQEWKRRSAPRLDLAFHPSVTLTFTAFHHLIRGYDEHYELWGGEDVDLLRRLTRVGLQRELVDPSAFYLHQWHPKYENIPEEGRLEMIRRNHEYLNSHYSIVRNDAGWGRRAEHPATRG
jgi:predicted glycosyltransferase involved in capsule biosynthesis